MRQRHDFGGRRSRNAAHACPFPKRCDEISVPRTATLGDPAGRTTPFEKGAIMIQRTVTLPQIGLIASTRVALGAGIGLLLADRLNDDQRRAAGWTLLAVGALTTIP